MLQFGGQELDCVRKTRGREDFVVDALEDLLSNQLTGEPFAENTKEVRLFDVLFAVERSTVSHTWMITSRAPVVMRVRTLCAANQSPKYCAARCRRYGG